MRCPSFANVAYARAMSSGLTASWPRPIEKNGSSRLRIPSACAVATTALGVTSCVSCAYTALSERTIASARLERPA